LGHVEALLQENWPAMRNQIDNAHLTARTFSKCPEGARMTTHPITGKFAQLIMAPVLVAALGMGIAQAQPQRDHRNDDHHDNRQDWNHGNDHRNDRRDDRRDNFQFRDQDRGHFESHYRRDINRWRHSRNRPRFYRGQRIPSNYRIRVVPRSYYVGMAPPPPGYQYGYYDGYVVAYDPTTRIIADVMDLVASAANQ
jgi:Ni/Co efflux regulator RcnB